MKIIEKTVSIIIPFSRPQNIPLIVKNIFDQGKDKSFEIILVGKGSKQFADKFKLKVIDNSKIKEPGRARNLGAKIASGRILIFLDDDCLPQKQWLKENIRALQGEKIGAVGGMIKGRSKRYSAKSLDFANFTFAQSTKRQEMPVCAASLAIKKETFQKARGFDEEMRVGEDTDLCMRLKRLGYKIIYEPKIKVLHDHHRETLKDLLIYQYNNGRSKGLIIENRYPDNLWFAFLKKISNPLIYWIFVFPFAVLATLTAVLVNITDNPWVIFYAPGIFIGKLACQCGIFVWTLRKPFILA